MIIAVVINLYGVIAADPFEQISSSKEISDGEKTALLSAQRDYFFGAKSLDYLVDTYSIKTGLGKEEIKSKISARVSVDPKFLDLVRALRSNGLKTILAANMGKEMASSLDLGQIKELFDKTYFSFESGLALPDAKLFKDIAKKLDAPEDNLIYIDAADQNLAIAAKLGLKVVKFESEDMILGQVVALLSSLATSA